MAMILKNVFQNQPISRILTNVQTIIITRRCINTTIDDDVQIISTEAIKPSSPTPNNLRTYNLSLVDQLFCEAYVPLVFFYSANCKHQDFRSNSDFLKQSLAKTLTHYYPFAGRLVNGFSVECNDHGATFIEAHVDSDMSQFLQPPSIELVQKLIPPSPLSLKLEVPQRDLLSVQVNYFSSGDVAVGISIWHGFADGSTVSNLLKTWGEITRGVIDPNLCNVNGVVLDFSSLFPPINLPENQDKNVLSSGNIVYKRFVFDGKKIAALKQKVNKELMGQLDDESRVTRFTVVSAILWHCFAAIANQRKRAINKELHTYAMYYPINLRDKINPPMNPRGMGNLVRIVRAERSLNKDGDVEITSLVKEVMKAKREASNNVMNGLEYLGFMKEFIESWKDSTSFSLSSIAGLPFYEIDFGWGKPVWFTMGANPIPDLILLTNASDGEGIEATVVTFKEDMNKFEQDPIIMSHASSNPSIFIESSK